MADVTDLLMPKLGLTMTEGTVSRWLATPGRRFAAGDVIVVVETDKIANDVEAPAEGELVELLSAEGEVVPVGAPIARWRLEGGALATRPSSVNVRRSDESAATRPAAPRTEAPPLPPQSAPTRIIATPYARRLAREAALDLTSVAGSGPRGRIKAADVLRARESPPAGQPIVPAASAVRYAAASALGTDALSFATADVDIGALRALDGRLAGARERPFERRPYIALACVKVLDSEGEGPVRLGIPVDGGIAPLMGDARDTLSAVAARLVQLEARKGGGDVALFIAEGRTRLFVPAVPEGWRMALGVGGVRAVRGGDATHEMTLTIVYDAAVVAHDLAAQRLARIAALLEEPYHLLAV